MSNLPKMPKKAPRPKAMTIRLSDATASRLKQLAKRNNLSQADVIEFLVDAEFQKPVK